MEWDGQEDDEYRFLWIEREMRESGGKEEDGYGQFLQREGEEESERKIMRRWNVSYFL